MKCIGVVLAFFLLGGCGTYHTLEELEDQALISGDWSQVERREHKIAMRTARSGVSCPAGTTLVCQRGGVNEGCACIAFDDVQNSFADWD
jgi:hypothetical protein